MPLWVHYVRELTPGTALVSAIARKIRKGGRGAADLLIRQKKPISTTTRRISMTSRPFQAKDPREVVHEALNAAELVFSTASSSVTNHSYQSVRCCTVCGSKARDAVHSPLKRPPPRVVHATFEIVY